LSTGRSEKNWILSSLNALRKRIHDKRMILAYKNGKLIQKDIDEEL
jgi:hypothetical protein